MDEKKDLRSRLVIGNKRDGRREYDEIARDELVRLCLQPGVSIARTAIEYDINANMLRTWMTRYQEKQKQALQEQEQAARGAITVEDAQIDIPSPPMRNLPIESPPSRFVPVVSALPMVPSVSPAPQPFKPSLAVGLHVRLPNGVEFDFGEANLEELTTIIQMLGRMPCSGSTKI
jgi:transposase